ncbi:MAG TPA: phospholipase D-like domain-containing protein [Nocardioides sp.]|nr:phospholipase D-like domain-containing protein [Nocardioides sp.]
MRIAAAVALLVLGLLPGGTASTAGAATPVDRTGGAAAAAAAADTWRPPRGQVFNNPTGTREARLRIIARVHAAIAHTPAGGVIRIATYNIGLRSSADLLLRAHARGVRVQVVVNDNLVGDLEARLQRRLGSNPYGSSFLVICRASCRNGSSVGNMHLKVYSFSKTGAASNVIISSSSNLGGPAAFKQWNDAYTTDGDREFFDAWRALFRQLSLDRAVSPRRVTYTTTDLTIAFQRHLARTRTTTTSSGDAVYHRLRGIGCRAPAGFGDGSGRTLVTVNMYAWYGDRGERLARLLAAHRRNGCNVRVIGSLASDDVVRILRGAGIPVRAADWDWGRRLSTSGDKYVYGPRCYSHLKFATVSGSYLGQGTKLVWTGSENWSAPALSSDEVTYEIRDAQVFQAYNRQWLAMWQSPRATHRPYVRPTSSPCP